MKRTLSFLLPAAAMLLAACGGANDRPSFPDFQEMADPAAAFADWSAAGDTPCASFVTTDRCVIAFTGACHAPVLCQ